MVTSANPSEGKTTTTANMAVVFAQQGFDALLVYAYPHQLIILFFLVEQTQLPYSLSLSFFQQPKSPISEQYRNIRTNIEFAAIDTNLHSLMVTSLIDGVDDDSFSF
jgi:Mrp family chromosome partitioning ATPase